jgi:hypothetical protein
MKGLFLFQSLLYATLYQSLFLSSFLFLINFLYFIIFSLPFFTLSQKFQFLEKKIKFNIVFLFYLTIFNA